MQLFTKLCLSFLATILLTNAVKAQTSTAKRKSSNAYRNNFQRVASGSNSNSTFEIRADGTLWAWGDNSNGQLGDSTTINKKSPTQIGSDNKWVNVSAGPDRTLAIKSNGTLWAWGSNRFNGLGLSNASGANSGLNANLQALTPKQVGTDNNWVSVSAGRFHSIALKSNGTLWGCGYTDYGQLGLGYSGTSELLVQIGTDSNWVGAAAGYYHTTAIKSDGTLWAFGDNSFGELGDGTTTQRLSPIQIGTDTKWVSVAVGNYITTCQVSQGC
ncbi:MAG: hypothetical protein QM541_10140 [Flavobacterium sp.]|nr:hypothetical protein [Flavobacterium sp.]